MNLDTVTVTVTGTDRDMDTDMNMDTDMDMDMDKDTDTWHSMTVSTDCRQLDGFPPSAISGKLIASVEPENCLKSTTSSHLTGEKEQRIVVLWNR
jgi:hypothetical protein